MGVVADWTRRGAIDCSRSKWSSGRGLALMSPSLMTAVKNAALRFTLGSSGPLHLV